ncbi:hypothetical protein EC968_001662 [Mortierella alpina]|nr:hypothetical protein EC968_001662 [Mortierella alpina]
MHSLQQHLENGSTRATVFDIPLLADLIARHLSSADIYRCTLVSRHFHNVFQHCVYTCICIHPKETFGKFSSKEAASAFSRHISSVREVSTTFAACVTHLVSCISPQAPASTPTLFRNLTVFEFHPKITVAVNKVAVLSLLEASPALQVVNISGFLDASDPLIRSLAKIIRRKGRRLREFRLDGKRKGDISFCMLVWSCAAIEVLDLDLGPETRGLITHSAETALGLRAFAREALSSDGSRYHPTQAETTVMTEFLQGTGRIEFAWKELGHRLLTGLGITMFLDLLPMCPFLERLSIPEWEEQDIVTQVAPVIATSVPHLRHLDIGDMGSQASAAICLMQSCRNLETLILARLYEDTSLVVDAMISGHSHSLKSLDIRTPTRINGEQLTLILHSCPRLTSLYAEKSFSYDERYAPILNAEDMARVPEEPGWSCKDLEILHLYYECPTTIIGIPEALWRQIGQLSKLKDLKLKRYRDSKMSYAGEKESVRQAITAWTALSNLRRLELRWLEPFVDEALDSQVRKQWPRLEWIRSEDDWD